MMKFECVGDGGFGVGGIGLVGVPWTKAEKEEEGSSSVTELSAPEVCLAEGPWALACSFSEEDHGHPVHHWTSARDNCNLFT